MGSIIHRIDRSACLLHTCTSAFDPEKESSPAVVSFCVQMESTRGTLQYNWMKGLMEYVMDHRRRRTSPARWRIEEIWLQQRPKNLKIAILKASQEREWLPFISWPMMHHPWRTAASAHAHVALPLAEPACSLLGVCLVRRTAVPAIFMTHTIVIHHQLSNHGRGSSISPAGIHMILEFLRLCLVMVSYRLQRRGNLQGRHERAVKMRTYFTSVPWPDRRNLLVFGEWLSNGFDLLVPFRHAAGAAAPQWKPAQGMQCVRVQNFRWAYCTMVKVMSLHWSSQIINMC